MEDKNEKIIFCYKPVIRNDEDENRIASFVGLSSCLERGLRYGGYSDMWSEIKPIIEEGKEGKYTIGDIVLFILPETFSRLHTQQYPLVVLDDLEKVVDIDEWWYTPFKKIFFHAPVISYSKESKKWKNSDCCEGALESGYMVRIKNDPKETTWLYGLKTRNITFNLDD